MEVTEDSLKLLRTWTGSFMNHVYYVKQTFDVIPNREHHASCINFVDLQEYRNDFCEELVNTIPDWIYSNKRASEVVDLMIKQENRTLSNAQSALRQQTFKKFRNSDSDSSFLQGQFGELILFNLLQHFFDAVPLVRKMAISTSPQLERNGADAIHYNFVDGTHLMYLGEAKAYTSKYKFATAFKDALESILNTYKLHREEIKLYIYDDFLDESLVPIANSYKNGTLKPIEVHLVSIILYNETEKYLSASEKDIKSSIVKIIENRAAQLDRKIFEIIDPALHPRFNYILFPIWKMDELIKGFQKLIGK